MQGIDEKISFKRVFVLAGTIERYTYSRDNEIFTFKTGTPLKKGSDLIGLTEFICLDLEAVVPLFGDWTFQCYIYWMFWKLL